MFFIDILKFLSISINENNKYWLMKKSQESNSKVKKQILLHATTILFSLRKHSRVKSLK